MSDIDNLLIQLESLNLLFQKANPNQETKIKVLRNSLLKSAKFSSKIENADTKQEIDNLFKAYLFVTSSKNQRKIDINLIKKLHQITLNGIIGNPGSFRIDPCAIYNTAGVAIYLAPPSQKVPKLINDLIKEHQLSQKHPLIKAAIFQFKFEKIHPFLDGNGRVGRLISYLIMYQSGYSFNGYLSPEEYLSKYREIYYDALEPNKDYQPFVHFFLESLINQLKIAHQNLNNPEALKTLLPRRQEIYEIIKDHPNCSFDFIHRRFITVNPKTIHYDLSKLQKDNYIIKAGVSRGATYVVK